MTDDQEATPPLLKDEADPPGGWVDDPGCGTVWRGAIAWRIRRGDATIEVSAGRWHAIEGARTAGGSDPGRLVSSMGNFGGDDLWLAARPGGPGRIHGRIAVGSAGVVFTPDAEQPKAVTSWGGGEDRDLRDDLAGIPGFLDRVLDRGFATALYLAFENRTYARDGSRFWMSFRAAGAFVAEARGVGEEYLDFYCSQHAPGDRGRADLLAAEVQSAIVAAGWRAYGPADAAEDAARVVGQIAIAESRRAGARPAWAPPGETEGAGTPDARLRDLARTGRLSEAEYGDAFDRAWLSDPERKR